MPPEEALEASEYLDTAVCIAFADPTLGIHLNPGRYAVQIRVQAIDHGLLTNVVEFEVRD